MELEKTYINGLFCEGQGFEKAREQVCWLYPKLNLHELDYFRVAVNGHLVEEINLVDDQNLNEEIETVLFPKEVLPTNEVAREITTVSLKILPKNVSST